MLMVNSATNPKRQSLVEHLAFKWNIEPSDAESIISKLEFTSYTNGIIEVYTTYIPEKNVILICKWIGGNGFYGPKYCFKNFPLWAVTESPLPDW